MRRSILVLAACGAVVSAAGLLFAAGGNSAAPLVSGGSDAGPPIMREPILFYDVAGYSIAGEVNSRLSVYNDGTTSIASSGWFAPEGFAETQYLPIETVEGLRTALLLAGAGSATDNLQFATDMPVTTVTFFVKPGSHAKSNTYNYWFANPEQEAADLIIRTFVEENFPGASW